MKTMTNEDGETLISCDVLCVGDTVVCHMPPHDDVEVGVVRHISKRASGQAASTSA
jgi:hypothetical protein